MKSPFRKPQGDEADATIAQVTMTDRLSYAEANVRVTYLVAPAAAGAFEATREAKVKMKYLPQAGQRVRVLCDLGKGEVLRVITVPGQEVAPPPGSEPTQEIPWNDSGHANWWANGTRRR